MAARFSGKSGHPLFVLLNEIFRHISSESSKKCIGLCALVECRNKFKFKTISSFHPYCIIWIFPLSSYTRDAARQQDKLPYFFKLLARSSRWEVGHLSTECQLVLNTMGNHSSSHVDLNWSSCSCYSTLKNPSWQLGKQLTYLNIAT